MGTTFKYPFHLLQNVAFIRSKYKNVNGKKYGPYYYLVENKRKEDGVRQKVLKYLGKDPNISEVPVKYRSDVKDEGPFEERDISVEDLRPSLFDELEEEKEENISVGDRVRVLSMEKIGKVKAKGMNEFLIEGEGELKWEVWEPENQLEKVD